MPPAREHTVPDLAETLLIKSYFIPLLLKNSMEHSLYWVSAYDYSILDLTLEDLELGLQTLWNTA